jgi:hypothetical protein
MGIVAVNLPGKKRRRMEERTSFIVVGKIK